MPPIVTVFARLRPGVSWPQATAELDGRARKRAPWTWRAIPLGRRRADARAQRVRDHAGSGAAGTAHRLRQRGVPPAGAGIRAGTRSRGPSRARRKPRPRVAAADDRAPGARAHRRCARDRGCDGHSAGGRARLRGRAAGAGRAGRRRHRVCCRSPSRSAWPHASSSACFPRCACRDATSSRRCTGGPRARTARRLSARAISSSSAKSPPPSD